MKPRSIKAFSAATVFIFLNIFAIANPSNSHSIPDSLKSDRFDGLGRLCFTANVLSPFHELGRFRAGLAVRFKEQFMLSVDYSFGDHTYIPNKPDRSEYLIWAYNVELHGFTKDRSFNWKKSQWQSLSIDFFYIYSREKRYETYYYALKGGATDFRYAIYKRKKYGANLNMAFINQVYGRIGVRAYAGIGFRTRINEYAGVNAYSRQTQWAPYFPSLRYEYDRREGEAHFLNFSGGIKLWFNLIN